MSKHGYVWATQWPTSSEFKIKFDPSLERSWCEYFKVIKGHGQKKIHPKGAPGVPPKLDFHKIWLGEVFLPYLKRSLPEGESHSNRKMENAEAWMATNAINIHDDLSKGSAKKDNIFYEKNKFWYFGVLRL